MNGHNGVLDYDFDFFYDMISPLFKMMNFAMIRFTMANRLAQVDGKDFEKSLKSIFPLRDEKEGVDHSKVNELINIAQTMR